MYEEKMMSGTMSSSGYANAPETQRMPQVNESLDRLEHAIDGLQKMGAVFEEKLMPVLRNEPVAAGSNQKEADTVVPIANRINDATRRLERLLESHNSLLRRLEV